ncbi:MAG: hypothetical protein PWQ70_1337 [Clostridiales bacterium]|jgi:aryl-alcohol dehydrogenase-like predicted oxidoreductase|nr:hypothetical protein [Clostridiales bacterium]
MRYKQLGNSDLQVSAIGLGTWAIGGASWGTVDDSVSINAIVKAIDCGINLIDTAPAYGSGHSEEIVGKAIKGHKDDVIIATKCGVERKGDQFVKSLKPEFIRNQIDESLLRLGVDVIDLYQIHWPDPNTPLEDTVNELIKLKEAGKFRYLGVSNFDKKLMAEIMEMIDIISLQSKYSILSREIESTLPFCIEHNIGVLAYGPLDGGILTGKYKERPQFAELDARSRFYSFFKEPLWSKSMQLLEVLKEIALNRNKPISHVAINWVKQQEAVTTVLVGAKTPEQVEENAAAGAWELSTDEINQINDVYKRIFA